MKWILLSLTLLAAFSYIQGHDKKVICYWGTWSHYRPGNGQFRYNNIDGNLCTHVFYSFFGISAQGGVRILDNWLDFDLKNIQNAIDLKKTYPKLKIIASIGGWNEPSAVFSQVASTQQLRNAFANNVLRFIEMYKFDGVDIDWEYPGKRGGNPATDRANFVLFLEALYKKLHPHGYEVMIATNAAEDQVKDSYDLPKIHQYLDNLLVMAYDLHGTWDDRTGHNAPLYPQEIDTTETARKLTVNASISYFLRAGFPANKLVVGLPLYGHTFALRNAGSFGVGAAISGAGVAGPVTQTPGVLGYNEVCERLKTGYVRFWDSYSQVPYAVLGSQWISYDDPQSIELKAQFALDNNLAGAMVWSIETDDFRGLCGEKNPLLNTIKRVFDRNSKPEKPTESPPKPTTEAPPKPTEAPPKPTEAPPKPTTDAPKPTTHTTTTTTTAPPPVVSNPNTQPCKVVPSEWRHQTDCNKYFTCVYINFPPIPKTCPSGTYYDPNLRVCNWISLVSCP